MRKHTKSQISCPNLTNLRCHKSVKLYLEQIRPFRICLNFFFFFYIFFWFAPFGYLYFFLFFNNEPELGVVDPGMALTPLSSSIGLDRDRTHNLPIVSRVLYRQTTAFAACLNLFENELFESEFYRSRAGLVDLEFDSRLSFRNLFTFKLRTNCRHIILFLE